MEFNRFFKRTNFKGAGVKIILSILKALVFLSISSSAWAAIKAKDFEVLTYKEPPFVMFDEGTLYGVATDVINEALARAQIEDYYIRLYPKKRTEFYAGNKKNTMYFPALKTQRVTGEFVLVGPIIKTKVFAYALVPIEGLKSIDDIVQKGYKVAVASGSRQYELLTEYVPPSNIQPHPNEENNIEKLKNDRVDIWVTTNLNAAYLKQRKQVEKLYPVYEFEGYNELFLAIRKDSNDKVIKTFKTIFKDLNRDGVIQKVQGDFLKNLEIWSQSSF